MLRAVLDWIVGIMVESGIDYQITGGLAANLYGSGREVYDIDIEVSDLDVGRVGDLCREYIIWGPDRFVDDNFDLLLMTLEYGGQLIDICGIDSMYIKGELQKVDLSESILIDGYRVVGLKDLIEYKRLLGREVDLLDIELLGRGRV